MTATLETSFDVHNPGSGDVVGQYAVETAADIDVKVEAARVAAEWWSGLTYRERADRLDKFAGVLARRLNQLAGIMREETGKPSSDAALEVALVLDHLKWAGHNARKVLGRSGVGVGLLTVNNRATVEYKPLGVVGVIGPWNYPVFTPMGSIAYALAAGNTVLFKPSEFSPGVGKWLVDMFNEVVPEYPVLQLVTGDGSTGAALCRSGVDKIAFTGSTATAKKVMAACAENLIPLVAECGGKDVCIVDEDADLDAAAQGAAWAGLANAGQSCIGTERILVHEKVYDAFLPKLVEIVSGVRAGIDDEAHIGPITMPKQLEIIRGHLTDALARGANAVVGGGISGQVVEPTVLTDVPADAPVLIEETFGPVLPVVKVTDTDEAIRLANSGRYGLSAAVYSKNGDLIARRLRTGMVSINGVFNFPQIPSLPFGGVGDSGFGRIHGADGLREFTYAQSIATQRFAPVLPLTSFKRTAKHDDLAAKLMAVLFGRR